MSKGVQQIFLLEILQPVDLHCIVEMIMELHMLTKAIGLQFNNNITIAWFKSSAMTVTMPVSFTTIYNVNATGILNINNNVSATCGWISGICCIASITSTTVTRNGDSNSHNTRWYIAIGRKN